MRLARGPAWIQTAAVAIQLARARYISRSAVWPAAYAAREATEAERTGEIFYVRHPDAPEHHNALWPRVAYWR